MIFSMFIKYSSYVWFLQIPWVFPVVYHFLKEADVGCSHLARSVPLAPLPRRNPRQTQTPAGLVRVGMERRHLGQQRHFTSEASQGTTWVVKTFLINATQNPGCEPAQPPHS